MKRLILAASLLLASPANAVTLLPHLYAKTFCEMRSLGVSKSDATNAAVRASAISGDDWSYVTIDGKQYQSDTVIAVRTAYDRCPEAFK